MLFNRLIAIACCIVICISAAAQTKEIKIKFGDIKPDDFKQQVYSIDSSADAVYLDDIGSMKYEGNTSGWFSIIYKVHKRIRLLSKKSFDDLGTVEIPLYIKNTDKEELKDLEAATYNIEDGKVIQTKVDKTAIFQDKDGDYEIKKFTFPAIKEGCIIEYTYTTKSPFYRDVPGWGFQSLYPRLWSQYTIDRPQFFDLVVFRQGYLNAVIDTSIITSASFNVIVPGGTEASKSYNINSSMVEHTWAYKDVPSLKEENYITSMSNYIQRVDFQFSAIRFPDEQPQTFMTSWPETADQLMKDEDFGQDLDKENGWLKDDVRTATAGETNYVEKPKKIYEFVRDNYTCIDHSSVYLSQPLKKTEQLKKGNVVDINILLIAMLKIAGYSADPVLLSTREHGKTYDVYPILKKFNYLIVRLNLKDNKSYLLDAAEPVLGFGHLDESCYNGSGRIIATMPVLIDLSADSLHESEVTSLFLSNGDGGKILGTYKDVMGEMQSESMRDKMKKINTDDYFKDVKKSFSFDVDINNKAIDSLNQPENPVSVQYDLSFKPEDDILYFTPILADGAYRENPFKATQRFYPVEMPYCIDETYVLSMEVPTGYKVDELPKSARLTLNDKEGMFEYLIQQSGDNIQLRCRTKLNKATFDPDDYETLRNFFAYVVEKESEQIVFKKQ